VIHDLDESLRALIRRDALNGSGVEVSFEAPTKDWAAKRTIPTINVYLYDIREDVSRRDVFFEEIRDDKGKVVERRQPPRRFKLSYLLTAWTQRPEDEHRLLSALLGCFLRADTLPPEILVGTLADLGRPVLSTIALPPAEDRSINDTWSALGGELKPSLDLVVTAPFDVARTIFVGPPVEEEPRLRVARPQAEDEHPRQRRRKARGQGGDGAGDDGDATGTASDDDADEGAAAAGAAGGARGAAGAGGEGRERDISAAPARRTGTEGVAATSTGQDETVRSGAEGRPGRVFRVRTFPEK
jgi:hypothetical protein